MTTTGELRQLLGPVGIWMPRPASIGLDPGEFALSVEEAGFGSIWVPGVNAAEDLAALEPLLAATKRLVVATGIASVWTWSPAELGAAADRLTADYPDRFVLGLGVSHAPLVEPTGQAYARPLTRGPISLPGRLVIVDYGEVISLSQSAADRAIIADLAGVRGDGEPPFWRAYYAHRDGLDQGSGGVAAYWQAIAADIGASWDDARVHELWAADFRSWLSINPSIIEVLADLKAGRTRLVLLSNAGPDYGSYFRHGPLGDFFAACYVSGELNLLKPHPEIYRHVLDDQGVSAADAVFIDNRDRNVRGAEAVGITGHVFTGVPALRSFLTSLQ